MKLAAVAVVAGLCFGRIYLKSLWGNAQGVIDFAFIVGVVLVCFWVVMIYGNYQDDVMTEGEHYPASVDYLLATKDTTILNSTAAKTNSESFFGDDYTVTLTLEDKNHVVTTKEIYIAWFQTQTRTDISEMTIDLDEKIVYLPFNA